MQEINKTLNRLFFYCWIAFFVYVLICLVKDCYVMLSVPKYFMYWKYIKYKYMLYAGMLICSLLTLIKIKRGISLIWLCFVVFLMIFERGGTPENRFYSYIDRCYLVDTCEKFIEKGYLKIEDGKHILMKNYDECEEFPNL